jgi:hypothetical protein
VKPAIAGIRLRHLSPWQTSSDYGLVNGNYRWQASFRDFRFGLAYFRFGLAYFRCA